MISPEELRELRSGFKGVVSRFAQYDEEKEVYETPQLDQQGLLNLDRLYQAQINQFLTAHGIDKDSITKQYEKLKILIHPDKIELSEFAWLDQQLSQSENTGMCFRTMQACYEKLIEPSKFKEITPDLITDQDDFKQLLENCRKTATSYTSQKMYECLIEAFEQKDLYYAETGKVNSNTQRKLLYFIPVLLSGVSTFMLGEAALIAYLLAFLLNKGGQVLQATHIDGIDNIGALLVQAGDRAAQFNTISIAYLIQAIFWSSSKCYSKSLEISTNILLPLLTSSKNNQNTTHLQIKDYEFTSHQLRLIAAPLEYYLKLNAQQFFSSLRLGGMKRQVILCMLEQMTIIDTFEEPLAEKLIKVKALLLEIKKIDEVYSQGENTKASIDSALDLLSGVQIPPDKSPDVKIFDSLTLTQLDKLCDESYLLT